MNDNNETTHDDLPDRLSVDPNSPYYNADVLSRDVGIRFKGVEKTNVEEYCVSEGWIRVTAGPRPPCGPGTMESFTQTVAAISPGRTS